MNILRIELRRSIAPWAGLALVVVALGFLFLLSGPWWKLPAPWMGHTTTAAMWTRFLLVFLWPVVVGAGAIQGMRDSRSGMVELLTTSSRPGWHRAARLAGAVGGLSALGFLLVFVVGLVEVLAHGGFVSVSFLPVVVVGMLGVVAGSWFGLAIGRLLPHPLTAPALAVVTLVASMLLWMALEPQMAPILPVRAGFLGPALAAPRGSLVTAASSVDLGQAVWFVGLAATGFLVLAANSVRARLLGMVPMMAGVAIALPLLPATIDTSITPDSIAAEQVCDGPVCVSRLHEDRLAVLAGPGREALALLAKLPGAPTRVEEQVAPGPLDDPPLRDPDVVYLDFQRDDVLLTAQGEELKRAVVAGAGTPTCDQPDIGNLGDEVARTVSAAWFLGDLKPMAGFRRSWFQADFSHVERAWQRFRALSPEVQRERIIAVRQALLTCQSDPFQALLPGPGPLK